MPWASPMVPIFWPRLYLVALFHEKLVEVAVEGIDVADGAAFIIGVAQDDDVAPAEFVIDGEDDDAVADGINGIAEIGVAAAGAVPVLAQVAVRAKAARFVIISGVGDADGEVEGVGDGRFDRLRRDGPRERGQEQDKAEQKAHGRAF